MAAPSYRFLTLHPSYAANGDKIVAELPLEQVKWSRTLSGAGPFSARINARHPKATLENIRAGYHQIAVERNGVIMWNGPLWTVQTSLVNTDPYLTLGAQEWFSWFASIGDTMRALDIDPPVEWDSMDQVRVAEDCIVRAQTDDGGAPNANMGVQIADNALSGVTRDMSGIQANTGYGEIISGMAEKIDGFDFLIDSSWDADAAPYNQLKKTFFTYSPRRIGQSYAGLSDGMAITAATGTFDATRMGTHVIATGTDVDATADAVTDYWRRDLVRSWPDIIDQDVLDAQALAAVSRYGRPVVLPSISVMNGVGDVDLFNSFSLGDLIPVDLNEGYLSLHADLRIVSFDVDYQQGTEIITFNLNDPEEPHP